MGKKKAIICDIDNCYTDSREWMKDLPLGADREGWDNFQKNVHLAKPNTDFIEALKALVHSAVELPVIFITGRENRGTHYADTVRQIEAYSGDFFKVGENCFLYMRDECDYRASDGVKEEILIPLLEEYDFLLAVDDELQNCKMFNKFGIETILYSIEDHTNTKVGEVYAY